MQRWEYFSGFWRRNLLGGWKYSAWEKDFDLDELGHNGWELVQIIPESSPNRDYYSGVTTGIRFFFKRPYEE